jgi:hypothetical protein
MRNGAAGFRAVLALWDVTAGGKTSRAGTGLVSSDEALLSVADDP